MSILETIKAFKQQEVATNKYLIPVDVLEQKYNFSRTPLSVANSILAGSGIIAEFKRASPSKGNINKAAMVGEIVSQYGMAGASAISVLTDREFFKAQPDDLQLARKNVDLPILRKEFIVDGYQILEAKALGADAVLLIAAILSKQQVQQFSTLAHDLGLEVLIEVHHEAELEKLCGREDLVGINNRNLGDFSVSLDTSIALVKLLDGYRVKISESGLDNATAVVNLKRAGFNGFLIGEYLMKSADPGAALSGLITQISTNE
jgi:indole-3-glycerol phosphate synthase